MMANTYTSRMSRRVNYRFQIDSSYTCGRARTMRKSYEWTGTFLKREKKKLRFQTNTDTCGQGLSLLLFYVLVAVAVAIVVVK